MSDFVIWSAPEEPYENHVRLCLESWNKLKERMLPALSRLFDTKESCVNGAFEKIILCHDIGKLSWLWQEYIHRPKEERKLGPPHATLGAPYLLSLNTGALDDF